MRILSFTAALRLPDRRIAPQFDRRMPCGRQGAKPAYSCLENLATSMQYLMA